MSETEPTGCTEGHQQTLTADDCVLAHGKRPDGCQSFRRAKVGYLCFWHRDRLDVITQDINNLWLDLDLIIEAGTAPKEDHASGKRVKGEPPAPANLEVLSLRDPRTKNFPIPGDDSPPMVDVMGEVASWVLMYAEERPIATTQTLTGWFDVDKGDTPRWVQMAYDVPIPLPSSVVGQLDLLTRHHEWAAAQPWIDDYWTEMNDLRRALKRALHDRETPELGRCLHCNTNVVEVDAAVVCPSCSAKWVTAQELARLKVGQAS